MRLIDADDLCKVMMHEYSDSARLCGGIAALIANQPTVNAVEVVRCKDCDNYDTDWIPNRGRPGEYWCPMIDGYMSAEDYCSRGERKEQP